MCIFTNGPIGLIIAEAHIAMQSILREQFDGLPMKNGDLIKHGVLDLFPCSLMISTARNLNVWRVLYCHV